MKSNGSFCISSGLAMLALLLWGCLAILVLLMPATVFAAEESQCITCHREVTPNIVKDFLSGEMGKAGTDCSDCHGSGHKSADDVANVQLPTEKTCQKCHQEKHDQYMAGKHAAGWPADRMPDTAPPAIPAIPGINFPRKRRRDRKPAGPATWDLITRSGRCGPVPNTE